VNRRDGLLLRIAAAWTIFVWVVFVRNLFTTDHDAGFIFVHVVLAIISVAFAFAIWQVAARNRREAKHPTKR
jgi:hypothetical protein